MSSQLQTRKQKQGLIKGVLILLFLIFLIAPVLILPEPSGQYSVGQTTLNWTDISRPEVLTEDPNDFRELVAVIWYPAKAWTGISTSYFPGLSKISKALAESGEVAAWETFGLRFVHSSNRLNAELSKEEISYPVVILSPGNGTNIEFYNNLASELASHGYVVVGLNHPYDVAAAALSGGRIAHYNKEQWQLSPEEHQKYTSTRMPVRVADMIFALDQLEHLNTTADNPFVGRLDLDSVAAAGHSIGGITASEVCKAEPRFKACLNFDGLQAGGPFSTDKIAEPPAQPFLFITKESRLHPYLVERFEITTESYWVIVHDTTHDSYSDAALLRPSFSLYSGKIDQQAKLIKLYILDFLNHTLKHQSTSSLSAPSEGQDASVKVFP
jgi:dienelactone hydrolase